MVLHLHVGDWQVFYIDGVKYDEIVSPHERFWLKLGMEMQCRNKTIDDIKVINLDSELSILWPERLEDIESETLNYIMLRIS